MTPEQTFSCRNCGSAKIVKAGFDKRKRQRFLCKDCGAKMLFDAPNSKPKDLWKMEPEALTDDQRETMNKFRAVNDGEMTLNELLGS